jgi:peptidoglycan hydrolase CwlO-like protein
MSEDFTRKFSESDRDTILTAIQKMDSRLQGVEKKVDGLEKTVNEKLYDTRPIWHKVVDDIGELQAGQKRLEEGQQAMRAEMSELNSMVRSVNRDQIVLNDSVRRIQFDFHDVNERLHKLTVTRNQQNSTT